MTKKQKSAGSAVAGKGAYIPNLGIPEAERRKIVAGL